MELDERAYVSVDELIRTTQQLSPISSSRQEHPAVARAGDNAADTAAVADVDANTSSPRTPSEPSLSEQLSGDDAQHSGIECKVRCGTVSTPPVVPVHRHNGDANSTGQGTQQQAEMGAGVESLTISSLTAGAVAAAAAQPGVVFELRVRSVLSTQYPCARPVWWCPVADVPRNNYRGGLTVFVHSGQ